MRAYIEPKIEKIILHPRFGKNLVNFILKERSLREKENVFRYFYVFLNGKLKYSVGLRGLMKRDCTRGFAYYDLLTGKEIKDLNKYLAKFS